MREAGPHDKGRPSEKNYNLPAIVQRQADYLADLDALAENLRGYFVVQVTVDDNGHRRTHLYRSAAAAERCVERARERGRTGHVTLAQLLPVGVVAGMTQGGAA